MVEPPFLSSLLLSKNTQFFPQNSLYKIHVYLYGKYNGRLLRQCFHWPRAVLMSTASVKDEQGTYVVIKRVSPRAGKLSHIPIFGTVSIIVEKDRHEENKLQQDANQVCVMSSSTYGRVERGCVNKWKLFGFGTLEVI